MVTGTLTMKSLFKLRTGKLLVEVVMFSLVLHDIRMSYKMNKHLGFLSDLLLDLWLSILVANTVICHLSFIVTVVAQKITNTHY